MKLALIHLLLVGAPPWLVWNLAEVDGAQAQAPVVIVQRASAAKDSEAPVEADGEHQVIMVRAEVAPGKTDGRSQTAQVRVLERGKDDAQRGWLGVSIGEVPEALAAQLDTEGRGVIVSNVIEDSPADKAGFEVHDVIVSVNGEAVEGESGRAVDLIKSRSPGDAAKFAILRNGKEMTLTATLGSRADMPAQAFAWKFETAPDAEVSERIKTKGKMIHRGPGGQWTVQDLGDLHNLAQLPEKIRMFVPQGGERTTQVFVEDGNKTIRTRVERDGSTISVEQKDDGPITVTRTDDDGEETVAAYDDEDALQAADEEAHKIFAEAGHHVVINLDGQGTWVGGDFEFDGEFDFDFDFDPDAIEKWQGQLDGGIAGAKESYGKAMEELHASLEKLHGQGLPADGGNWPMVMARAHGKPKHSFEVRTDGTIEARIRKGDSELVQLYSNAADLQKRNPDLAKKYQELMSIKD